jgi:hypothetical protein
MKKIFIYIGENIQDLKFSCGGELGFDNGVVRYSVDAIHRHLIEERLHPRKVADKVAEELRYCQPHWDLHISTHSDIPLNLIGLLVHDGLIDPSLVTIYGLSPDNKQVEFISTYEAEGYLKDFPYGFFEFDSTSAKAVYKKKIA